MSFLAAAFLAGLAALALPWWLHRRETTRSEQRVVSSLLLMRPGEAPEQMHRTLRHRWLLALRMLLFAVLVLAFAQPVLERTVAANAAVAVLPRLIAVDTSLSMDADFAAARAAARRVISELPRGGRAAVVDVADRATLVAPLTADTATLYRAVDGLEPGAGRLTFDGLTGRLSGLAGTLLDDVTEIHLVSDFQRTAMPAQFNALVAGTDGPVVLHRLGSAGPNWLVESVAAGDTVTVTVRGFATPLRQLELVLEGAEGEIERQPVTIAPNGRAVAQFALPAAASGDTWLRATLNVQDALDADDERFHVLRRQQPVPLPVYGSPGAAPQLEYLTAAIRAGASRFRPADLDAAGPVVVAIDPGDAAAERVRRLERHLANGGALLLTTGPATLRAGRLAVLDLPLTAAARSHEPRRVVTVDDRHPVLAGARAWQSVIVNRHVATERPVGNVLLALDDGTPLLVEHRIGAGRVLVLMTALDPAWSNLVATPAFVGFVSDALGYLAEDTLPSEAVAGQALAIPAANVQLFDHSGRRMLALGETVGRPNVPLDAAGIYTLRTPSRERLLAVNADLRESDLTPADPALLARWQSATDAIAAPAAAEPLDAAGVLPLSPWLLAALGLLALLEPTAANLVTEVFRTSPGRPGRSWTMRPWQRRTASSFADGAVR